MMVERMFPDMNVAERFPKLVAWRDAVTARPAVAEALKAEDRTTPRLRTWPRR